MRVRFHEDARAEFDAAADFYDREAPGLGEEFIAEVETATTRLVGNLGLGSRFVDDTRRVILRRFPYSIIHLVAADDVVVIAVAHHRRKPGSWRDRL